MDLGLISLIVGIVFLLASIIDAVASLDLLSRQIRIILSIIGLLALSYGAFVSNVMDALYDKKPSQTSNFQAIDPTQLVVVTSPVDGDSVKCRILTQGTCPEPYEKDMGFIEARRWEVLSTI